MHNGSFITDVPSIVVSVKYFELSIESFSFIQVESNMAYPIKMVNGRVSIVSEFLLFKARDKFQVSTSSQLRNFIMTATTDCAIIERALRLAMINCGDVRHQEYSQVLERCARLASRGSDSIARKNFGLWTRKFSDFSLDSSSGISREILISPMFQYFVGYTLKSLN